MYKARHCESEMTTNVQNEPYSQHHEAGFSMSSSWTCSFGGDLRVWVVVSSLRWQEDVPTWEVRDMETWAAESRARKVETKGATEESDRLGKGPWLGTGTSVRILLRLQGPYLAGPGTLRLS